MISCGGPWLTQERGMEKGVKETQGGLQPGLGPVMPSLSRRVQQRMHTWIEQRNPKARGVPHHQASSPFPDARLGSRWAQATKLWVTHLLPPFVVMAVGTKCKVTAQNKALGVRGLQESKEMRCSPRMMQCHGMSMEKE